MAATLAIQGLSAERLCAFVGPELTLPEARKILSGVHRRDHPLLPAPAAPVLDGVRNVALAAVARRCHVGRLQVSAKQASAVDPFAKWVFRLADGLSVETVRIPLEKEGRFCVCVSSQAGCAQGCTYCATGKLGLLRSLQTWEIVEQVRTVRLDLAATGTPGRIHGVVFQGMGEPMANLDAVLDAISVLSDPAACQISASNVTVSTVGSFPNGIRRLAKEAPKVRLALSVGAARPEVRARIMPVERVHPLLGDVMAASVEHAIATGMQPLWAITPLLGVNDDAADAEALAELAHDFTRRTGGIRPRISIVPYNAIAESGDPYQRVPLERESAFRNVMRDAGVFTHKRYSGGGDVGAACGQLAGKQGAQAGTQDAPPAAAPDSNWAGQWAAGVREERRPTLDAAYTA